MKVGVVLPTYNTGETWRDYIKRFADSATHIACVDNLEFLINYQAVDSAEDKELAKEFEMSLLSKNPSWTILTRESKYEGPVSMVNIRNDCMTLDMDCDVYFFVDDDMKFNKGAGEHYADIIRFMEEDDSIGLVMSAGFLGGYKYVGVLKFDVGKHWHTCRGLFLRNMRTCAESPIYPKLLLECHQGGGEESFAAFEVLKNGLKCATYFNNPTYHKLTKFSESGSRYDTDKIHEICNVKDYMEIQYGITDKVCDMRSIQRALVKIHNQSNVSK